MPVKVKCSGCEAVLNAPDRARGKAVKCPKCGTPIRVPAEGAAAPAKAKRKPASVAAGDTDEFLTGLDVNRLEDRSTRVCPKCGGVVGAEDVDCPLCGADLATGGLGTVQRARRGRKGAHPSEYYGTALRDGAKYVGKKQALAWKSFTIFSVFGIVALMGWLMLVWCHNWPPQMFWTFVASVFTLLLPGWVWLVQNQVVKRTLNPKEEKYPVRMDPFVAVSLGVKSIAWSLLFGLPVWILLGVPGLVMTKSGSDMGPILLGVASGVFGLLALVSWPVAQAHFAMPITWPGWAIHKVLPDVGRNIGPSLYWATFALLTFVPVAGVAAGGWFLAGPKLMSHIDTLTYNAGVNADKQAVALADPKRGVEVTDAQKQGAEREFREEDWTLVFWPMGAIVAIAVPLGFWTVFNTRTAGLFVKLFRPNIEELIAHEKEYVYVAKTAEEREKQAQAQQGWGTAFASVAVVAALGLAGGMIYATFAEGVGYLAGLGLGLTLMAGLASIGPMVAILKTAWADGPLYVLGILFVPFFILFYCIKNWEKTKLPFVTLILLNVVSWIGWGLSVAGAVSQAVAGAPPAA
jgi:hypothetical protein